MGGSTNYFMREQEIIANAYCFFKVAFESKPSMSLRSGVAIDVYQLPVPFDAEIDQPTDDYIEANAYFALPHLDTASWKHYLPHLIEYVLDDEKHLNSMVGEGLLWSLRPPDREPPRLESLTKEQKEVITNFLSFLAFEKNSSLESLACQVLEEYWIEDSIYGLKTSKR